MRVTVNGQAQQQLVQANTAGSGRTPNPKTTSSVGSPAGLRITRRCCASAESAWRNSRYSTGSAYYDCVARTPHLYRHVCSEYLR